MVYPAFAAEYDQIVSTSDETLDVGIYTIPEIPNTEEPTKLKIDFLKSGTEKIQQHIDYRVSVTKDGDYVFGPMSRLLHTSPGSITIPVEFSENGAHIVHIEMEGILFQPIPLETATLTINVGQAETSIPSWIKNNAGWWADGQIDDGSFVSGLQWLISNGIMILTQETAEPKPEVKSVDLTISSSPILEKYFAKYVDVFGVPVYATSDVPDDKVLHAAQILAQYLDNDADGTPDNPLVVEKLKETNSAIPLFANEWEDETSKIWDDFSDVELNCWIALYADETNPRYGFDASLEEILHVITQCGYAVAYPEIFGEHKDSLIAKYMDNARGGYFEWVPGSYPNGAWWTYDDNTCYYNCMITEYFYWSLTSILGAQDNRWDVVYSQWKPNTEEKVMETDPDIYNLLTDPQYKLPTILPDGNYQG